MQSILFGNGFNRLTKGNPSWDELLDRLAKDKLGEKIPNTLKFETIILKQPYRDSPKIVITPSGRSILLSRGSPIITSGEVIEHKIKREIADQLEYFEPNEVYDYLSHLSVNNYITTNYDNTLLKSKRILSVKRYRKETLYSILRHYVLSKDDDKDQIYWPIHGNMDSPNSIMLGYDHYCGSLSRIQSYIKGSYNRPDLGQVRPMIKKLSDGFDVDYSWIDLFFSSDIHIIGHSMAYEEMDLWWILNKRCRMKLENNVRIDNHLFFYPTSDKDINSDKRQLLKVFDVEIKDLSTYHDNYEDNYKLQLEQIDQWVEKYH